MIKVNGRDREWEKENIFLKNIDFFKLCGMLKHNIGNATIPIIRKEGYLCYVKAS